MNKKQRVKINTDNVAACIDATIEASAVAEAAYADFATAFVNANKTTAILEIAKTAYIEAANAAIAANDAVKAAIDTNVGIIDNAGIIHNMKVEDSL
jgi:hypothetical protein